MNHQELVLHSSVKSYTNLDKINIGFPDSTSRKTTYYSHAPIIIGTDGDFNTLGINGTGSSEDPYIIEGLQIITNLSNAISIQNVEAYYTVRNCWLEASDLTGISLRRNSGASVTFSNNVFKNCGIGIDILNSEFVNVDNNSFIDISRNAIKISGFSNDITITNNYITNLLKEGILITYSESIFIINNSITESSLNGIRTESTSDVQIIYNLIMNNRNYGINIKSLSGFHEIHHNSIVYNALDSDMKSQCFDSGNNNTWYDDALKEGNFWSDYSGVGSYIIEGNANSTDPYPLITSPHHISLDPFGLNSTKSAFKLPNWIMYPILWISAITSGIFLAWVYERKNKLS